MPSCQKCGQPTRQVHPVMTKPPAKAFDENRPISRDENRPISRDENRPISRAAWAILDPAGEAALPWGEHPDDDRYENWCPKCVKPMKSDPKGRDELRSK